MGEVKQLGECALEEGLLTEVQLEQALKRQKEVGGYLGDILVDMWLLTEETKLRLLGKQMGVPYISPKDMEHLDANIARLVPQYLARKYHAIPIKRDRTGLTVVMANPFDVVAKDDLRKFTRSEILPVFGSKKAIEEALEIIYPQKEEGIGTIHEVLGDLSNIQVELRREIDDSIVDILKLEEQVREAPLIRLVNYIIANAVDKRASDIHIEPAEDRLNIRYRIDGVLYDIMNPPKYLQMAITSRIKVMAQLDIAERRLPQDGRFTIRLEHRELDLRVSTLPTQFGEKVVLRLLDKGSFLLGLEQMGLDDEGLKIFKEAITRTYGLILATGPTGSGKSTTLYSALDYIKSPEKNIVTIEDPVECQITGVYQVQAHPKIGLDFARGFRSILRQDPDIIMVGEIRDLETAEIAIRSSLTGHLVFSTLHTNDALGTIVRLINMGIEPFLVASAVRVALAQRLIRRICEECREPYTPSPELIERLMIHDMVGDNPVLYRGRGCKHCNNTGYYGRIGIYEVFAINSEIRELILQYKSPGVIKSKATEMGMTTLYQSGMKKVVQGITTVEEILRICTEED
ncbi:MAG: Flp pilus assembly complex ATPase component TadA [Deltaproteobacteria bacterium]|nr:Flp pilus assembly complex ATPase component TadA [Deltaproteobacteria bacterium]